MSAGPDFFIDDYVVYSGVGVCRVEALEKKSFDGKSFEEYLKIVPLTGAPSSYFVPVGMAGSRLRKPMTPEEVNRAIDKSQESEITLTKDTRQRKSDIEMILKKNDCPQIIALIRSINLLALSCRKSGKKVLVSDENALRTAQNLVYPEFSFVLGIDEGKVADYIGKRLGSVSGC